MSFADKLLFCLSYCFTPEITGIFPQIISVCDCFTGLLVEFLSALGVSNDHGKSSKAVQASLKQLSSIGNQFLNSFNDNTQNKFSMQVHL